MIYVIIIHLLVVYIYDMNQIYIDWQKLFMLYRSIEQKLSRSVSQAFQLSTAHAAAAAAAPNSLNEYYYTATTTLFGIRTHLSWWELEK